jgi:hypothetical protein
MPKRRIDTSQAEANDARVLNAIRESRRSARPATDEELSAIELARRGMSTRYLTLLDPDSSSIKRVCLDEVHVASARHRDPVIVGIRRGCVIYREPGKAGADLKVPPFHWRMLQQERANLARAAKTLRTRSANMAKKSRAMIIADEIHRIDELWDRQGLPKRNRVKRIASALGVSQATVKRARLAWTKGRIGSNRK